MSSKSVSARVQRLSGRLGVGRKFGEHPVNLLRDCDRLGVRWSEDDCSLNSKDDSEAFWICKRDICFVPVKSDYRRSMSYRCVQQLLIFRDVTKRRRLYFLYRSKNHESFREGASRIHFKLAYDKLKILSSLNDAKATIICYNFVARSNCGFTAARWRGKERRGVQLSSLS